jgi:hypothetical protein
MSLYLNVKKVTVNFTLGQAMKTEREWRFSSTLSLTSTQHGVVNATPRPLYPQERDPVPTELEAGWAPEPVWTGAKDIDSTAGFDRQTAQPVASLLPTTLFRLTYILLCIQYNLYLTMLSAAQTVYNNSCTLNTETSGPSCYTGDIVWVTVQDWRPENDFDINVYKTE